MNTDVRGRVKLKSANPLEYPSILFNYLSTEQECREWCEAIRCSGKKISTINPATGAVIYKPAQLSPLSALKLAEIYKEAGLPTY